MGRKAQENLIQAICYVILTIAILAILLPLFWIFVTSMKDKAIAYRIPPEWSSPTLMNYKALFQKYPFGRYFINTFLISGISVLSAMVFAIPAAYSISRYKVGKDILRFLILAVYMLPTIVILIPFFMLIQKLQLLDTYLAKILANLTFLLPYCIWMLIGFFDGMSHEIEEAAMVDGCTVFQALIRIVIPISAPGLTSTTMIGFIFAWNEFMFSLILTGVKSRTLPVGVANFQTQFGTEIGELCAATMLVIIPIMILAFSMRSKLVKGLSLGAVK